MKTKNLTFVRKKMNNSHYFGIFCIMHSCNSTTSLCKPLWGGGRGASSLPLLSIKGTDCRYIRKNLRQISNHNVQWFWESNNKSFSAYPTYQPSGGEAVLSVDRVDSCVWLSFREGVLGFRNIWHKLRNKARTIE